ncbi:LysR family transcriptional regulator [Ancylomarina sp. 16SWW S1-10-2]|uniref:LysR family transcriptional regulator n=1 Tax=Ancylomarina sp. 16SWW S1-10-2 TaxID=2499681 RepID=UPI0012AE6A50|nr:LysR family transcriptional regulator [Ancylomarina sp. 16SWW S1-10-2]MRT94594.1 LysR family transcriptional regulator [Ancylomarina sp. 16SWW S1-10-2]
MSNQIELRHYRYFLALAKDLHFRKAAERLYISQPGLSRQIKQMEEDLGICLFERHNRKVELTKAGIYLQKEIKDVFKQLDDITEHAKLLNDGLDGNLKLGFVGSAMQNVIPDLLLKYKSKHPQVLFSLNEMDNEKQIQALLNREIDVGFVRMGRVPRGINAQSIFEDTFSLVLPKDHPLDESNFESLSQFKEEAFILFESSFNESYHEKVMQIFDHSHFSPIISHQTVNASSIFRLVEKKFGVAIVPTSLKLGYNMNIKFIELNNIPQRTTLQVVWNNMNINPVLNSLINTLVPEKN